MPPQVVAHTGDLHLTDGERFDDSIEVLDWIAQDGRDQGVTCWLVGGDLTGTTVPHVATVAERNALARWLCCLAETAPVVVLAGNHDSPMDLHIYGRLRARHPIEVVTQPGWCVHAGLAVFCLPYPSKRRMGGTGSVGASTDQAVACVREILMSVRAEAADHRRAGRSPVALMHINVGGSVVGGGEVLIGREVELAPGDLADLGLDCVCLSHIHRAQEMAPCCWYAGSPSAQNHGEESDQKGYNLIAVGAGTAVCERRATPARRLLTIDMEWQDGHWGVGALPSSETIADADVRVRIRVSETGVATCPIDKVIARLREIGAHRVQVDRRVVAVERVRSEEIAQARTLREKLDAYWRSLGATAPSDDARTRALSCLEELADASA